PLALPAATEPKTTSVRPAVPPGFGGLPATRHGLETGPDTAAGPAVVAAGPNPSAVMPPAATRAAPDSPVTVTGAGPVRAPPLPSCPNALSPQPLPRPPAPTAREDGPPAA